ncbi:imidazoleglycerol-phosphate dehydratase HisB [Roseomonas elaeocarpi]|uniref:Imidazoleglycerol-phosphate dehydratase n=1 Tax=Roseomonas elaeocarpi TaxID=907779 RepID=A0ABV6JS25_9PROT
MNARSAPVPATAPAPDQAPNLPSNLVGAHRTAAITRETAETRITLRLDLDGTGRAEVATGIGFLDHMLTALARHALFDLAVEAVGDLHVDFHHTAEDVGIVLGSALRQALGDKRGIRRYGHAAVPMDEALVEAAIDLSGRAFLVWKVPFERPKIGEMDTELFEEFFRALSANGLFALHVMLRHGHNAHHIAEGAFKAVARALREAVEPDPRTAGAIPSTKGSLEG